MLNGPVVRSSRTIQPLEARPTPLLPRPCLSSGSSSIGLCLTNTDNRPAGVVYYSSHNGRSISDKTRKLTRKDSCGASWRCCRRQRAVEVGLLRQVWPGPARGVGVPKLAQSGKLRRPHMFSSSVPVPAINPRFTCWGGLRPLQCRHGVLCQASLLLKDI